MKKSSAILLALVLSACAAPSTKQSALPIDVDPLVTVRAQRYLELLAVYFQGTWSTVVQPANQGDSTPMRLRMARIWPERADGYWFYEEYVDQADDRKILRQRIFRLAREGTILRATMYRIPGDAKAYVGEWRKPRPFAAMQPAALKEAAGCAVIWQPQLETYFAGGTEGTTCKGDDAGAAYEHAEYYLGSTSMRWWIQGLNSAGNQVAGLSGPAEFRKNSEKLT